jgi:hypothetical protein
MRRALYQHGVQEQHPVRLGLEVLFTRQAGDRLATIEWSRRWPNEEAWIARKR